VGPMWRDVRSPGPTVAFAGEKASRGLFALIALFAQPRTKKERWGFPIRVLPEPLLSKLRMRAYLSLQSRLRCHHRQCVQLASVFSDELIAVRQIS